MEVFPPDDRQSSEVGNRPTVSHLEQMKAWDDSFSNLEKVLQAACEKNDSHKDLNNCSSELTSSVPETESSGIKPEIKRKWEEETMDSIESNKQKLKRMNSMILNSGEVTIQLVNSPNENCDNIPISNLLSSIKDETKTKFEDFTFDMLSEKMASENKNSIEFIKLESKTEVKIENHDIKIEKKPDIFSDLDKNSCLKEENVSSDSKMIVSREIKSDSGFTDDLSTESKTEFYPQTDDPLSYAIKTENNELNSKLDSKCSLIEVSNVIPDSISAVSRSPVSKENELLSCNKLENCEETVENKNEDKDKKEETIDRSLKKEDKLSKKKKFERCNIRDIKLDEELDAVTLSAQKEEQERIRRLQEAQMRALQERLQQIEVEKEALSQLFSQSAGDAPGLFDSNSSSETDISTIEKKVSIKTEGDVLIESSDEDKKAKLQNVMSTAIAAPIVENIIDISSSSSGNESDSDDSNKKDDDIMVLSDEGEEGGESAEDPNNSGAHTNDCFNLPDEEGRVLVNVGHPPEDPDIFLAPQIAKVIKPHQIGGIRFLYDNVVENLERYKSSSGFGCILAHSMGLGKTVQVVSFVDVFLRHTPATLVLCIVPINTIQNWKAEFDMWVPPSNCVDDSLVLSGEVRPRDYNIYTLNENFKTMAARAGLIAEWRKNGGVLLMGYEMYRMLALRKMPKIPVKKSKRLKKQELNIEPETNEQIKKYMEEMYEHIVIPGPDLVICDEGHRIKNSLASTSMALKSIKTRRRVVLTGYPLQNNLLEYWCMVDFVRPNYLGSRAEFCNMFERPISNGQCIDSTPRDRQLMRFRSHVLHSLLVGFVQRRGHSVLRAVLPKKEEHVLLIRMTPIQRQLYKCFVKDLLYVQQATNPLKLFAVCCKIWNHPDILYKLLQEKKAQEDIDLDIDITVAGNTGGGGPNCGIRKRVYQSKSKVMQRSLKALPRNIKSELNFNTTNDNIKSEQGSCDQGNVQQVNELKFDSHEINKEDYSLSTPSNISFQNEFSHQGSQSYQNTYSLKSPLNTQFCQSNYDLSSGIQYPSSNQSNIQYSPKNMISSQQQFSSQASSVSSSQNIYSQSSIMEAQYTQQPQNQFPHGNTQQFNQVDSQIQPTYDIRTNVSQDPSANHPQSPPQTNFSSQSQSNNCAPYPQQTDLLKQIQNTSQEQCNIPSNSNQDTTYPQSPLASNKKFIQPSQQYSQNLQQTYANSQTSQQYSQQQNFNQASRPQFSEQQSSQFSQQTAGNQTQTSFTPGSNQSSPISEQSSVHKFSSQSPFQQSSPQPQFAQNSSQQSSPLTHPQYSHQNAYSQMSQHYNQQPTSQNTSTQQSASSESQFSQASNQTYSQQYSQQTTDFSQTSHQQFQQENMQNFSEQQGAQSQFHSSHSSYSDTNQPYPQESSPQQQMSQQTFSQPYVQQNRQYSQQSSQENETSNFGTSSQFSRQSSKFSSKQGQQNSFSKQQPSSIENVQYPQSITQNQTCHSPADKGNSQAKFNQTYTEQSSESQYSQIGQPAVFSQPLSQSSTQSFTDQIANMTSQYTVQQTTSLQFSSQVSNSQYTSQGNKGGDSYSSQFSQESQNSEQFGQTSQQFNQQASQTSQYQQQSLQNTQQFSQQTNNNTQQFDTNSPLFSQENTSPQKAYSQQGSNTQVCSEQSDQTVSQFNQQVSPSFSQQQNQINQQFASSQLTQSQQYPQRSSSPQQFLQQTTQSPQQYNQSPGQSTQVYAQQQSSQQYSQQLSQSSDFNSQSHSQQYNQYSQPSPQYSQQSSQIFNDSVGQSPELFNQTTPSSQQYNTPVSQSSQFNQTSTQPFSTPDPQNSQQISDPTGQSSQHFNPQTVQSFDKASNQNSQQYIQQSNHSSQYNKPVNQPFQQYSQTSQVYNQPSQKTFKPNLSASQYNQNSHTTQQFNQPGPSQFNQKNLQSSQQYSQQSYSQQPSQSPQQYNQPPAQSPQQFNQPVQSPQQFSQPVQSPQQFSQPVQSPQQFQQQPTPSPQHYNQHAVQSPQQFSQPPAPSPQQYQQTTASPQQFMQQPSPQQFPQQPVPSPQQQFSQTTASPLQQFSQTTSPQQQFSQPTASPQQFSQPTPSPQQFSQPTPSPQHFSQPAPSPQQFSQPAPSPQQFSQPTPSPQQFSQPAPSPQQLSQPAPSPQQFSQPAPSPQHFSQPNQSPQQYSQPTPSPQQFSQPTPSPQQFSQPAQSPQSFSHPSPTPQQFSQPSASSQQLNHQNPQVQYTQQTASSHFSQQSPQASSNQNSHLSSPSQYKQQIGQSSQYSSQPQCITNAQTQFSNTFSQPSNQSSVKGSFQNEFQNQPSVSASSQNFSSQTVNQPAGKQTSRSSKAKQLRAKSLPQVLHSQTSLQSNIKQPPSFSVQAFQNGNPSNTLQRSLGQQSIKSLQDSANSLFPSINTSATNQESYSLQHVTQDAPSTYPAKCSKAILQPVKSQIHDGVQHSQINSDVLLNDNDHKNVPNSTDSAVVPFRDRMDSSINYEWAVPIMKDYVLGVLENSHKMMVLFVIIAETLQMGDKLLVFSQSLSTLDLLEQFLSKIQVPKKPDQTEKIVETWSRNKNYFRLDGSTSAQEREKLINEFNRNDSVSLFLLSTRAGCLGINLVGANRIVVMDASWNPCHDAQAVCRIYRYGQKKQCYIYRLVTDNSLEKRIYDRQVNKQGMSDRVVDELNPESNFTWKDVTTLIQDDEDDGPVQELSKFASSYTDRVLKYLVSEMSPSLSKEPFEHESLLLDRKDLKLTKQEKRLAKQSYEMAKRANMINIRTTYTYLPAGNAGGGQFIINNKQCQWVGGTTIRVLPNQNNTGGNARSGTTATPITASPSLMSSLFKQGVMVQKLTMPSNVSIPVLTPGAPPVVIPAGQDVLVLRTPKGVYLRLPDGRIIAVQLPPSLLAKTQFRPNVVTHFRPAAPKGGNQGTTVINTPRGQSIGIIKQTLQCGGTVRYLGPRNAAGSSGHNSSRGSAPEVIDLSDDEEPSLRKHGLGSNTSANSSESESGSGDVEKSEKASFFPGKHITIRKISSNPGNSSPSKEKCEIPQVLSKNKQITILPINPSAQQSRQKFAPQLAQPVRVQQMLLNPQQGKRKQIQKSIAKIQMSPLVSSKSVCPQITITHPNNSTHSNFQPQKIRQPLAVPASKNAEYSEKHNEPIVSSSKPTIDASATKLCDRSPKSSPVTLPQGPQNSKNSSASEPVKMQSNLLPPSLAALAVNPNLQITPASRSETSVSDLLSLKPCFPAKSLGQSTPSVSCHQNENSTNNHSVKSSLQITPTTRLETVSSDSLILKNSQHSKSPVQNTGVSSSIQQNISSTKPVMQMSIPEPILSDILPPRTVYHSKSPVQNSSGLQTDQSQNIVQSLNPNLQITPVPRSEQSSTSDLFSQSKPAVQNAHQGELSVLASNSSTKTSLLPCKTDNSLPQTSASQNASNVKSSLPQRTNFSDTLSTPSSQLPAHQLQNSLQSSSFQQLLSSQTNNENKQKLQSQQQSMLYSSQTQSMPNTQMSFPSTVPSVSTSQSQQHTTPRKRKSSNKQPSKKSQQQHLLMPQNHVLQPQTIESPQPFLHPQLSEHLLPDNHFPTFSHHISGSDFTFSNFSSHKPAAHIQHPQPLHPLQHSQEHSLLPHLQHMSHLYPMPPHLGGTSSLPDAQPPAPRAWPVPQPSVSSFHPFSQSSPFFSSGQDSQFSFPSSFPLPPSTLTPNLSQSDSNSNVASGSEKSSRISTSDM